VGGYLKNSERSNYSLYIPKKTNMSSRVNSNNKDFLSFLSKCLKLDPTQRFSAKEALNHPFIKNKL